ncbi:hypothetical protein PMAYCL1PPCAC_25077, partial [Pristionchus mayeri]
RRACSLHSASDYCSTRSERDEPGIETTVLIPRSFSHSKIFLEWASREVFGSVKLSFADMNDFVLLSNLVSAENRARLSLIRIYLNK